MATQSDINGVRRRLQELRQEAENYFEHLSATDVVKSASGYPDWDSVPGEHKETASQLAQRLKDIILAIIEACKNSPLAEEPDTRDLRFAMKRMSAALRLRRFYQEEAHVLHDEGTLLGIRRPIKTSTPRSSTTRKLFLREF